MRPSQLLLAFSALCLGSTLALALAATDEIPLVLPDKDAAKSSPLDTMAVALATLQDQFFSFQAGTYPTGIDWTRAVLGTLLAASTNSLSASRSHRALSNRYFAQVVSFFYGQDDVGLKQQAFDDILWVVLQWLEAVKMIDFRTATFPSSAWTGVEWKPTFAQRALEFYELAETGWDEALCGGGMVWSPWLEPYKNAITNELFISASVSMYLYHPQRNVTYLDNAKKGYNWLKQSNMQNAHGLYTDGFHISRLNDPPEAGEKKCDERDEMVYTYNQGVLLSGLRGLAEATEDRTYLEEGFELINAVITSEGQVGEIVRDGILTEKCDPESYCSQNGHTFKGIWMHHLTLFCVPLPVGVAFTTEVREWHEHSCAQYNGFITRNAAAAWATRNKAGVVGAWWGAPKDASAARKEVFETKMDPGAADYLNPKSGSTVMPTGGDLNDRGRGRTVESHSGGLAALRAVLEVVR